MLSPVCRECGRIPSTLASSGASHGRHDLWVCALLFLATLLNYLDRQTVSVAASKIAQDFGFNDGDLGKIFFAFLFAYGITQIFIGSLLDRLAALYAYAFAVAAWSMTGAAVALAHGFWSLLLLRVLLGVCESPNWPLALRVVSRIFPPSQRSLANGVFQSGTSIGALIAPPVIIYLTNVYSWRFAFVTVGVFGIIWSALWLHGVRVRPELRRESEQAAPETPIVETATFLPPECPSSLREILRSRSLWGLMIATCFLNPLQYFYTTWLPRYFHKYAGVAFGRELAERLIAVYLALGLGLLTGGALVALLSRRLGVVSSRKTVTAAGTLCMMSVPAISRLASVNGITAVICLATFGLGGFMVNYLSFASEVSPKRVATATGILGGAGSLAGASFMLLVGSSVERSGGFSSAFLMAGLMPLVALAGIWFSTSARQTRRASILRS